MVQYVIVIFFAPFHKGAAVHGAIHGAL